jgi:hypothetical protein
MARATYVFRDGKLIDKRLAPPLVKRFGRAPNIRTDGMDATWNPADGKTYDSRSGYYRAVKDAGCVIAGDDSSLYRSPQPIEAPGGVEQDIKQAIDQLS